MPEKKIEKLLSSYIPFPMCIINHEGKVVGASKQISEVFIYDKIKGADFFVLTGFSTVELEKTIDKAKYLLFERNDKRFRLLISKEEDVEDSDLLIFFYDITNYEKLKNIYNNEKTCIAIINIDNYDELIASTTVGKRMTLSTEVDGIIRRWVASIYGSINKLKDNVYIFYFENIYIEEMIASKFEILDKISQIETEADFPLSLSIGVGIGGKTLFETEQYANAALDLALGRGGDQAVVKRVSKIEYYGGKMQTVEKGNKGKSRVVAHALKQLIDQSKTILIMGHRNPDMDTFGASLGVHRICEIWGKKEVYIVINEYSDALSTIFTKAKETEKYKFIDNKKAIAIANSETLIIVLDTHKPSLTECHELLEVTERIVVIDHHRKAEESITNPTLSYIESYASSTCELITEILQYSIQKSTLSKLEAEALLAGMTIDTNRFAVKTGVRTFEAAAWLRKSGADTTDVKRLFQTNMATFKTRAGCIASAEILDCGVALSICEGCNPDAQIINSQVADELLNIKGIKATFVVGKNERSETVVSARSLGDVNVQVIMEKFGGGGHLTTAGAQVEQTPVEFIEMLKEIIKKI